MVLLVVAQPRSNRAARKHAGGGRNDRGGILLMNHPANIPRPHWRQQDALFGREEVYSGDTKIMVSTVKGVSYPDATTVFMKASADFLLLKFPILTLKNGGSNST